MIAADVKQALESTFHSEWSRSVSYLLSLSKDLSTAEECVQAAFESAVKHWQNGIPDKPGAWIRRVARNRFIDTVRAGKLHQQSQVKLTESQLVYDEINPEFIDRTVKDDELALIFLCCHPAISPTDQVMLVLRTVAGMKPKEIAAAFFVQQDAVRSRLLRAKRKMRAAVISTELPPQEDLPKRLEQVQAALYLIYNEGYLSHKPATTDQPELVQEAIRLCAKLCELAPNSGDVHGLMALILYTEARRPGRLSMNHLVPLEAQDRSLWDPQLIAAGAHHLRLSKQCQGSGKYTLQARIAAAHSTAASFEQTDWRYIQTCYDKLLQREDTAYYRLNRIAAASFTDTLADVLVAVMEWERTNSANQYSTALRADILRRQQQTALATEAYKLAIEKTDNPAVKAFLASRLDELNPPELLN